MTALRWIPQEDDSLVAHVTDDVVLVIERGDYGHVPGAFGEGKVFDLFVRTPEDGSELHLGSSGHLVLAKAGILLRAREWLEKVGRALEGVEP